MDFTGEEWVGEWVSVKADSLKQTKVILSKLQEEEQKTQTMWFLR